MCAIQKVNCTKDVIRTAWDWRYEIAIMSTRPIHKNLFMEILKKPGTFVFPVDKETNVRKGILLKCRPFIKFWEPTIYKAEYMGRTRLNQVWAITFD